MARKTFARLGGHQQFAGPFHQRRRQLAGQRRFRFCIKRLVHRHDELRERMQPREPRVVRQQLEKMIRRRNGAEVLLVADALGIHQRLVQRQQRGAQLRELPLKIRR